MPRSPSEIARFRPAPAAPAWYQGQPEAPESGLRSAPLPPFAPPGDQDAACAGGAARAAMTPRATRSDSRRQDAPGAVTSRDITLRGRGVASESTPGRQQAPAPGFRRPAAILDPDTVPIPVDAHGPARAYACVLPDGRHGVVFAIDGGRGSELVDVAFSRPSKAIRFVNRLNDRLPAPVFPDDPAPREARSSARSAGGRIAGGRRRRRAGLSTEGSGSE